MRKIAENKTVATAWNSLNEFSSIIFFCFWNFDKQTIKQTKSENGTNEKVFQKIGRIEG